MNWLRAPAERVHPDTYPCGIARDLGIPAGASSTPIGKQGVLIEPVRVNKKGVPVEDPFNLDSVDYFFLARIDQIAPIRAMADPDTSAQVVSSIRPLVTRIPPPKVST
jgi:hypothetical protein